MTLVFCAVGSALLFLLRDSYWPLAWIAPVPLLWLAYGARSLRSLILATTGAVLLWGSVSAVRVFSSAGFSILPQIALQIGIVSVLYIGCFAAARYAQRTLSPILTLLMFPAVATGASYLMMLASGGDSYGSPAYSQVDVPVLIQSASLFGLPGLEFLLALFANGMALALRMPQQARFHVGAVVAVAVINVLFGVARFHSPTTETLRVAAAARDLPLAGRLPAGAETVSSITLAYATEGRNLASLGAKVIVFPELTAVLTPQWQEQALAPIQAAGQETGASISVGFAEIGDAGQVHNVALTFRPGNEMARYVKRHTLLPLDRSIRGTTDGVLGSGRALAICKDLDFPATIRSDAQKDVRLMLVPAADFESDGWTHARMSIMRGVENGFAIVRAARNGLVTISDDRGRVIARGNTNPTSITHVIANVPLGRGDTHYRRFGDYFARACVALAIVLLALSYRSQEQKKAL
jgi:apolipoprotein N-acyltransferase